MSFLLCFLLVLTAGFTPADLEAARADLQTATQRHMPRCSSRPSTQATCQIKLSATWAPTWSRPRRPRPGGALAARPWCTWCQSSRGMHWPSAGRAAGRPPSRPAPRRQQPSPGCSVAHPPTGTGEGHGAALGHVSYMMYAAACTPDCAGSATGLVGQQQARAAVAVPGGVSPQGWNGVGGRECT